MTTSGAPFIFKTKKCEILGKKRVNCVKIVLFLYWNYVNYICDGIKLGYKNIGFNGKFYTFPYFMAFLLKRFVNRRNL